MVTAPSIATEAKGGGPGSGGIDLDEAGITACGEEEGRDKNQEDRYQSQTSSHSAPKAKN